MKLLFTGPGTSGSWLIRGVQLGMALGATVKPMAPQGDHDLVVGVKRVSLAHAKQFRRWVWDIVDAYPQPASYHWSRDQAIAWVQENIRELNPAAVIWPTRRMREDCDTGLPGVVIPHHSRAGLTRVRTRSELVGYEGGEQYLGKWLPALEVECHRRGLQFVVNPQDYSSLTTVIAVRDGGGYVCRNWKSGVKHSNAVVIGARFIGQPECGYLEQARGGEAWVESPADLASAFDSAKPLTAAPYEVGRAARDLADFLMRLG